MVHISKTANGVMMSEDLIIPPTHAIGRTRQREEATASRPTRSRDRHTAAAPIMTSEFFCMRGGVEYPGWIVLSLLFSMCACPCASVGVW